MLTLDNYEEGRPKIPTRIRARDERGEVVTVLDARLPRRGKVRIRNGYGFATEVDARTLTQIEDDSPAARLRFGDDVR